MLCGFLMSVNFSNNLVFAMTFMLSGIALLGWWQTRINVKGLESGDWRYQAVFAGQPVVYSLQVNNLADRPRYALQLLADDIDPSAKTTLDANSDSAIRLQRNTETRGLLKEADAWLCSGFPLGLFIAKYELHDLPACLVYPRPGGNRPLPEVAEGAQAHRRNESGSYTDMRRYSAGDPVSRIAWRVLARCDEVYVKEFDGAQGQPALWLAWSSVEGLALEEKLSQLCRWVLDAERQDREYGLDIPGIGIAPGSGKAHEQNCLKALALYGVQE